MRRETKRLRTEVESFFFTEEVPYALAMCRICMPLAMLAMMLPRWAAVRELFSSDGATAPLGIGYGYFDFLPELSGPMAVALYSSMVLAFCATCVGWCTRTSLVIGNVLFTYFCMLDCASTLTKYTVIATHILFILTLSECGSLWSVDAWLSGRKRSHSAAQPKLLRQRFPAWPRRLIQLHIGFVYFGAAMTKMHTPTFFTGDQLQNWMQTHLNFRHPFGEYLSLYPILLVAMAYVSVVWEILFLFICWKSMWRKFVLPLGILFHFMTLLTLGLLLFPAICYVTYFSFIDEEDVRRCSKWFRRQVRHFTALKSSVRWLNACRDWMGHPIGWQMSSRAAFVFTLVLFSVMNVELEYWQDPYGIRRTVGRHTLNAADPLLVEKILAPAERMRDADVFFAIDTGTLLVGEQLANRRREFWHGETMIAQCHLIPPHDDMWIECQIHDAQHRIVDRFGAIATREMFSCNFSVFISEKMSPGDYSLVITTGGRPVMKKLIHVFPR